MNCRQDFYEKSRNPDHHELQKAEGDRPGPPQQGWGPQQAYMDPNMQGSWSQQPNYYGPGYQGARPGQVPMRV